MSEFDSSLPLFDTMIDTGLSPNKPTTFDGPYQGNTSEEFGASLAGQFDPSGQQAIELFDSVKNLGLLENTTSVPDDRYESNYAQHGDIPFQRQAQALIDDGTIDNNTFVISNTGHDIPIMATLTGSLDMDGTLNVPNFTDTELGNGSRVISQAETWGNEIASNIDRNLSDGSVSSFFLGIEGHRNFAANPLDISSLPTPGELKAQDIDKIVFLVEGPPSRDYDQTGSSELDNYLQQMSNEGIEVIFKGIDPRY